MKKLIAFRYNFAAVSMLGWLDTISRMLAGRRIGGDR